ncbi:hypothetical protein QE152_g39889 [Popillia japonica]|uniref:CCHC-type domain-containing protein n=1 Tax=Popillia japonica TaxID=7064 RepID=A0AAW1HSU1_POPJA
MNIMVKAYYDFDTLLKDIIAVDRVREPKDKDTTMVPIRENRTANRNQTNGRPRKCYRCGLNNHVAEQYRRQNVVCCLCKQEGHYKENCPSNVSQGRLQTRGLSRENERNDRVNLIKRENCSGDINTIKMPEVVTPIDKSLIR